MSGLQKARSRSIENVNKIVAELTRLYREKDKSKADLLLTNLISILRPIVIKESQPYLTAMPTYDRDDLYQEADILLWTIIERQSFNSGSFTSYYTKAVKNHFINLFRAYVRRNPVVIPLNTSSFYDDRRFSKTERGEYYGFCLCYLVESDYAKMQRLKHRDECHRSYLRKKERTMGSTVCGTSSYGNKGT